MSASSVPKIANAYYTRSTTAAGVFNSTRWTVGPWSPKLQHGGPPAALLTKAIEDAAKSFNCPLVTRMTFLLFKPIPVIPLRVSVEPIRKGKNVTHLQASLFDASKDENNELFRAVALCTRDACFKEHAPAAAPEHQTPLPPKLPSRADAKKTTLASMSENGYSDSLDIYNVAGEHGNGPTTHWAKSKVDLVEGEATSPMQDVLILADSAGGLSFYVDFMSVSFLNADMTINFLRTGDRGIELEDRFVGMEARTDLAPTQGTGLARATMFDRHGPCAFVTHSQLLQSRM